MLITPTQGLKKSTFITGKNNSSLEEENKTSMRLKEDLYSFLRKKDYSDQIRQYEWWKKPCLEWPYQLLAQLI